VRALETYHLAISRVYRYYLDMLRFDWDERKNKSNRSSTEFGLKRPRAFSATRMDAYFMIRSSEDRFILLGVSSVARTLVVVHSYRENDSVVRIISARKATRKEVRFYEEGI
jgi:uncharacterized protein